MSAMFADAPEERLALPSAPNAEKSLLCAIILDNRHLEAVRYAKVKIGDFHQTQNQILFAIMLELADDGMAIDPTTIRERAGHRYDALGGGNYVTEVMSFFYSPDSVDSLIRPIIATAKLRRLIFEADSIKRAAFEVTEGTSEFVDKSASRLAAINAAKHAAEWQEVGAVVDEWNVEWEAKVRGEKEPGITTGLPDLDYHLGLYKNERLVIIAGYTGHGKSSLAGQCIRANCRTRKHKLALLALEMPGSDYIERFLATETGIPADRIQDPRRLNAEERARVREAAHEIGGWSFWIDDSPGVTMEDVRTKARIAAREGAEGLLIDHAGLIRLSGKKNEASEITDNANGLKELAKELGIPIIALWQFRRVQNLDGSLKRPHISMLKGSSGIEQAADEVVLIWRELEEEWREKEGCVKPEEHAGAGVHCDCWEYEPCELIIGKRRGGKPRNVPAMFVGRTTEFLDRVLFRERTGITL